MTLLYNDPRMEAAVAFCWETQRMLTEARFYGWSEPRLRAYVESRKQLWRRFPSGVRTSAHLKFMEELHDQLGTPTGQRDKNKPVWLNEQFGIGTDRTDNTGDSSRADEAPGTR